MDELRLRIERARAEAEQRIAAKTETMTEAAQSHAMVTTEHPGRPGAETVVATSGGNPTVTTADDVLPVPIKFVFREAEFTDDGRKAAQLLLEYLLLKQPPSLRMSGHADERGTHDFNMNLSADRLESVATFLRAGGYAGHVVLIPRGDTEPFKGVDRSLVPRDQLYDLDRRVELQIAE
jgi:outer membrane protein OmpA-like peptidoglycan-associated protein